MHSHNAYDVTSSVRKGDIVFDRSIGHFVIIEFVAGSSYQGVMITSNSKSGVRLNLTQYGFKHLSFKGSTVRGSLSNLKRDWSKKYEIYGYY